MEDMGMTGNQFASYLNQLLARLEDLKRTTDGETAKVKLDEIIATVREDRDHNL